MVQILSSALSLIAAFTLASSVQAAAKTCTVAKSSGDDGPNIKTAFANCASSGTVVFPAGTTYNLKSMIQITGLSKVNVDFAGTINLAPFDKSFKGGSSYISIKGDHITWSGGGTINGNGQTWWDIQDHTAPTVLRIGATNSEFSHFTISQAPRAHLGVTSANFLNLHDINLKSISTNSNLPKNTDGLDISSSKNVILQNSVFIVGDDCTAVNGGVSNYTVSNVHCTNGHGFSVGSLGKGGETDVVSDIKVIGSSCTNCQNGLRIKTWPGGKGTVTGVKFENVSLVNTDNPIIITTHYCDANQMSYCTKSDDTSLTISDVTISSITGSASSAGNPIFSVDCSTKTPCSGFTVSGVTVTKSSKTPKNVCTNLTGSSKIALCSQ